MVLTADAEYVVREDGCHNCGLCTAVCAFVPHGNTEDRTPLGSVLASYVGCSTQGTERARGSSGGLATRSLIALLELGLVDGVIATVPTGRPGRLFEPAILREAAGIERASGSKYYPVEYSAVLRQLREAGGRYAVVALPCAVTALRRAQTRIPWVTERLKYLFGLVCGQGVSAHYTLALAHLSGLRDARLRTADYRVKQGTTRASDFRFVATGESGATGAPLPWTPGPDTVWSSNLLTLDACFSCTDLFATDADMTFMDAWLPQYSRDPRGTSIVLVRKPELLGLLQDEAAQGRVSLSPLAEEEVLRSQAGALARKQLAAAMAASRSPALWAARARRWGRRTRARVCKWLCRGGGWRHELGLRVLCTYIRVLGPWGALKSRVRQALALPVRAARRAARAILVRLDREVCSR